MSGEGWIVERLLLMTLEEGTQGDYYVTLSPKQQQQSCSNDTYSKLRKFAVKGKILLIN
jgi:hypothetical protein